MAGGPPPPHPLLPFYTHPLPGSSTLLFHPSTRPLPPPRPCFFLNLSLRCSIHLSRPSTPLPCLNRLPPPFTLSLHSLPFTPLYTPRSPLHTISFSSLHSLHSFLPILSTRFPSHLTPRLSLYFPFLSCHQPPFVHFHDPIYSSSFTSTPIPTSSLCPSLSSMPSIPPHPPSTAELGASHSTVQSHGDVYTRTILNTKSLFINSFLSHRYPYFFQYQ